MAYSLDDKLVIAITSRALFDLDEAHAVFRQHGLAAYRAHQREREGQPLLPGTGLPLVRALLNINRRVDERLVEVFLVSRNDADSGLRLLNSIEHLGLDISRDLFTGGRAAYAYLKAIQCDLFLSAEEQDVKRALAAEVAAGLVYRPPSWAEQDDGDEVRIAIDGDAVLFGSESERIYKERGLAEFQKHEAELEDEPLDPGPFKGFVEAICRIQQHFPEDKSPIRTALVTARNAPSHKRAIKTLRTWKMNLDEAYFLGGVAKAPLLEVFRPHIFFDDQDSHLGPAASTTPSALVPHASEP